MNQADAIVVMMTASDRDEARRLADMLVAREMAACVQMIPGMQSVYRWEGKIEEQDEILLIAKTVAAKFAELEKEVRAMHSYETPEIIALPVTAGSERYLEWLTVNVS
ncbi:MAG: divalent-cation tolerance protein CutA [Pyrinomonadaceae bacterium]